MSSIDKTPIPVKNPNLRVFMVRPPMDHIDHVQASCIKQVREDWLDANPGARAFPHIRVTQCAWTGPVNRSELRVTVEIGRLGA